MNINYNWKINTLFVIPQQDDKQDIVAKVSWDLTGTINDSEYGLNGIEELQVNNSEFIPFENLTENQVIDWVKTILGKDRIQKLEFEIAKNLREKEGVVFELVYKPAPWISVEK